MVEFHDARLRDALAQCGPIIEGYEGRLDAASADIKSLEAYLVGVGKVTEPVGVQLSETQVEEEESIFERLMFMQRGDRWRLMYVRSRAIGHYRSDAWGRAWTEWDYETPMDRRPLIEAPGEVRLRAVKVLSHLLHAVAERFTPDPIKGQAEALAIDFGEIPF